MENDGLLSSALQTADANKACVLTAHPRIGLNHCHFTQVIDGRIIPAKMVRRKCPTEMVIFIPVHDTPATRNKAFVILRNPHNHPMHPKIKPSAEDRVKLGAAVQAVGLTGLTAMRLLNAPSTSAIYGGNRVAQHSPAFASARKVRNDCAPSSVHPTIRLTELLFIDRSISEPDAHFNPELTFQYSTLGPSTDNGSLDVGMLGTTNSMDYPMDGAPNFDSTPVDSLTDFLANSSRTTYGFGASDSDAEAISTLGTTYDLPPLPAAPASLELNAMEGKASRKRKAKEPEVDERHIIPGGRATRSRTKNPKTRANCNQMYKFWYY
ncbi:hypothetical protein B0H13DRAFT_1864451 [Mycena leptocephala]|nr:hypothetical protein B0H13DRAFT_1864451 [Mycena leptocephala]